jgi:hypothetical protein
VQKEVDHILQASRTQRLEGHDSAHDAGKSLFVHSNIRTIVFDSVMSILHDSSIGFERTEQCASALSQEKKYILQKHKQATTAAHVYSVAANFCKACCVVLCCACPTLGVCRLYCSVLCQESTAFCLT